MITLGFCLFVCFVHFLIFGWFFFFNEGLSKGTCKHCEQHNLPNVEFYSILQPEKADQLFVPQAAGEGLPTKAAYVSEHSSVYVIREVFNKSAVF